MDNSNPSSATRTAPTLPGFPRGIRTDKLLQLPQRYDFVLRVQEIGQRLVEAVGPEVIAGAGVDELDIDTHAVSAALDTALRNVAYEFTSDLLRNGSTTRDKRDGACSGAE
jgi:hypothetical protein